MKTTKRLCLCALLCAASLTIFVLEAQIPLPIPIPGIKLGLANIFTLFALIYLTKKETFAILVIRIVLGSIFSGNPSVLIYSLSGGIICLLTESLLLKILGKNYIAKISIVGAMTHNTTQIFCASLITKTTAVFWYLPPLLITAAVTGCFCGLCVSAFNKNLGRRITSMLNNTNR